MVGTPSKLREALASGRITSYFERSPLSWSAHLMPPHYIVGSPVPMSPAWIGNAHQIVVPLASAAGRLLEENT